MAHHASDEYARAQPPTSTDAIRHAASRPRVDAEQCLCLLGERSISVEGQARNRRWTIALMALVTTTVVLGVVAIVLLSLHDPHDKQQLSCDFPLMRPLEPPLPGAYACRMIEHLASGKAARCRWLPSVHALYAQQRDHMRVLRPGR